MASHPSPPGHSVSSHGGSPNTLSVPFVILVALLIGLGLFSISIGFVTTQPIYFVGVLSAVAGGVLMLNPRAGSDHA